MAKFLLIEVRRGAPGEVMFARPAIYNAMEVERAKHGPIMRDDGLARGQDVEEELILIEDRIADKYAATVPDRFRILTEAEAEEWLEGVAELNGAPDVVLDDPDRVRILEVKARLVQMKAAGLLPEEVNPPPMTQADVDVLDPDVDVPGVRRPRITTEIFRRRVRVGKASDRIGRGSHSEPGPDREPRRRE